MKFHHFFPLMAGMLSAGAEAGWAALPLVSYSSGSGLLYGGRFEAVTGGASPASFSMTAYGTTRGGQYESFGVRLPAAGNSWYITGSHDQRLGREFYGWGNSGDPDSSLEYDRERDAVAIGRVQTLGPVEVRLGAEVRHSSAFGFEEGVLWSGLPGLLASSEWTAGPSVEIESGSCPIPVWEDIRLRFDWQRGEGAEYWTGDLERVAYVPLGGDALLALRYDLAHHHGADATPLPFLPFLGPDQLLRGYADDRFSGSWITVANIELRRPLFDLAADPATGQPLATVGAALFGDAGQASDSFDGIRWDRWHPDAGVGLSLTVEGIAVRLDLTALSPEGFHMGMSLGSGEF